MATKYEYRVSNGGAAGIGQLVISNNGTLTAGNTLKTSQNLVRGRLKIDVRPTGGTTEDYALQVRSESAKTSGTHWGLDGETHLKATGTASIRGTQGVAVVDATYTCTGGTLVGVYGQARADGTMAGSGFMAGLYGLIEASAAITASHVCSIWADSHQANAVTGEHELIYASNNGATTMDSVMYVYGGNKITNLFKLNTVGGMVSDIGGTLTPTKKVLVDIDGTPLYLVAGTVA